VETPGVDPGKRAVQRVAAPRRCPRIWRPREESNLRRVVLQTTALSLSYMGVLERITGNDPVSERWQRSALPLSYIRIWWWVIQVSILAGVVLQTRPLPEAHPNLSLPQAIHRFVE
jgi:hypothetical protein